MRRRLLTAMLLVAALAVAGFGVPLALAVQTGHRNDALLLLSQQAATAVVAVPATFLREDDEPELPRAADGVHLALYVAPGRKVQGQGPQTADDAVLAVLRGEGAQRRPDGLVVAFPVSEDEEVVAVVRASTPPAVVAQRTRRTWAGMAGLALLVLVVAGVQADRRSQRLARPLNELAADAALVGTGRDLPVRAAGDVEEIDAVRRALVQAARRLDVALSRERAFSADLAHQLRTPLTSLRLRLESEQLQRPRPDALVHDLLHDVDRLEQTIDDLLSLGRDTRSGRWHPLGSSVREAAERWRGRADAEGRTLVVTAEEQLPWVDVAPAAIRQILDVLLDNALRHGQGEIRLSGSRVGEGAVIKVVDEGPAELEPETVFRRRRTAATGSGIGLSLARRLAEAEGLCLVLASPGPRAAFHLVIPAAVLPEPAVSALPTSSV